MSVENKINNHDDHSALVGRVIKRIIVVFFVMLLFPVGYVVNTIFNDPKQVEITPVVAEESKEEADSRKIDIESGLVIDDGYELVRGVCGACHSIDLVTQNKATREGWKDLIVWMQETQKLWDLGENEKPILDYLEKNYAPTEQGRRAPLKDIDWYEL